MPCQMCVHFIAGLQGDRGICRLKSDSTGIAVETPSQYLCEFFEADPERMEELQMTICRHCAAVAFIEGEVELCQACLREFNIGQLFKEIGTDPAGLVRFHCSRPYRERWLRSRLEVKPGGLRGVGRDLLQ